MEQKVEIRREVQTRLLPFMLDPGEQMNKYIRKPMPEQIKRKVIKVEQVLGAIETIRGHYPEAVFPKDGETLDSKAAQIARLTCDNIKHLILLIVS